jgi:hypothetical protein
MEDLQTGHDAFLPSHGSMHCQVSRKKEIVRCLMAYFARQLYFAKKRIPTSLWNLCKQGRWRMVSPIVGISRQTAQASSLLSVWETQKTEQHELAK